MFAQSWSILIYFLFSDVNISCLVGCQSQVVDKIWAFYVCRKNFLSNHGLWILEVFENAPKQMSNPCANVRNRKLNMDLQDSKNVSKGFFVSEVNSLKILNQSFFILFFFFLTWNPKFFKLYHVCCKYIPNYKHFAMKPQ